MKITKAYLYIGIGIVLFLVALSAYFYHQGKKGITIQTLPNDTTTDPTTGQVNTGLSNTSIKEVADGLYNEMNGLNLLGHKMEYYKRALLFSDTDLVRLYNMFNTEYQQTSSETLVKWIEGEQYSSIFENEANILFARLQKLNLI
jgi:hypothetical protein